MIDHYQSWAAHALGLMHEQVAPLGIRVICDDNTCTADTMHKAHWQ